MTACKKHRKNPAKGYSPCPGCEVERLNTEIDSLRADAKRLDFLDGNARMKMGWHVGVAPAGNVSVQSVISPNGPTSIRDAIDAAMPANLNSTTPGDA